jgi:ribosome production factor 1
MNHFTSILGATVGRYFMALFPQRPQFNGRQVVTFHHQRDFIFFRRHRYMFEPEVAESNQQAVPQNPPKKQGDRPEKPTVTDKVRLQELGPRFTLKLLSIQEGLPTSHLPFIWQRTRTDSTRAACHL